MKPGAIAGAMGSNVSAVKVALHRVRAALRVCIEARLSSGIESDMKDPMALLDEHFDGILDEAGAAELSAWVKQNRRNARLLVDAARLHQDLRELFVGRRLLEEAASSGTSLHDAMILPAISLPTNDEPEAQTPPVATVPARIKPSNVEFASSVLENRRCDRDPDSGGHRPLGNPSSLQTRRSFGRQRLGRLGQCSSATTRRAAPSCWTAATGQRAGRDTP